MDRQKVDELPALQVQFFESTGIPVFKVWIENSWFYVHDFDDLRNCIVGYAIFTGSLSVDIEIQESIVQLINVFSREAIGFHWLAKLFELN